MRIVVGIPTVGRGPILCETLRELARQTRQPDGVIVCGASDADLAGVAETLPTALRLTSRPGLPRQRNRILDAATDADIVVFFDDDFLADPRYLASMERHMAADPAIVVATGRVLADGITGPGLSVAEGRAILAGASRASADQIPTFTGYGCNMAVRVAPMTAHGLRFDERLPLYGWQEDVDLSRRLAFHGSVVALPDAAGVHLGAKSGRTSGVRLGYSQVANPLYLARKRSGYPFVRALDHIGKNMAKNLVRSFHPEPHVDRLGRLRGNLLAIGDLVSGTMRPERILDL